MNWKVFDLKTATSLPSKWEFATDDLDGHAGGISEVSGAKAASSSSTLEIGVKESQINYASHLILKDKAYYDLELFLSYHPADANIFGVAFRYLDPFNFYAVEFRKGDFLGLTQGYKRIVKVQNGEYEILSEIKDGGFN